MSYTIETTTPVLVTGGTGYVAGVLIQQLLEAGVTVHTTVRDATKTTKYQYLLDLAAKTTGTLKVFSADLLKEGSFAEAMAGCSVVFHTASPFITIVKDPTKDLIEPAVHGTENVLNTAKSTPTVKKVVVTSSCAAVSGGAGDGYKPALVGTATKLTEEHWNRTSNLIANPYSYSKTLAETKAWTIAGSQTQWKLVTINPALVLGPGVTYHETSTSYQIIVKQFGNGNMQVQTGAAPFGLGVVDVREVATAHIAAAYSPTASGRYLLVGHNSDFAELAAAIRTKYDPKIYPVPAFTSNVPKWLLYFLAPYVGRGMLSREYVTDNYKIKTNYDNTKSIRELGINYRSLEDTCTEMYQQLIDLNVITPTKAAEKSGTEPKDKTL